MVQCNIGGEVSNQLRGCICLGLTVKFYSDRDIYDGNEMDIVVCVGVQDPIVTAGRVHDYLIKDPEVRFVFGSFGRHLGPVIDALRRHGIGANVCGYHGGWAYADKDDFENTNCFFKLGGNACIVLGHCEDRARHDVV